MQVITNVTTPQFYTVKDIMDLMQISRNKAYALFNSKGFPSFSVGKKGKRIEKSEFEKWYHDYLGKVYII